MTRYLKCFRDFSGGLAEEAGDNMADNQLQQARNAEPGRGGGLRRAAGTRQALPPLPGDFTYHRALDLVELPLADGSRQLLAFSVYAGGLANLWRYDEINSAWTALAQSVAAPKDRFIRAHRLYWLTGRDIKVYDGSTISSLSPTPAGDSLTPAEAAVWRKVQGAVAVEQRGRRWFYATADNEVIFSAVGDPALIAPTSIINVEPGGGDRITALQEFCGGLLIFLTGSVCLLEGWDLEEGGDVRLSRLNVTCGTSFPRTVQAADNAVYYLGRDGIYRLRLPDGSRVLAAENLSQGKLRRERLRGEDLTDAWAAVWQGVYRISLIHGGGQPQEFRCYPGRDAFFGPFDHGARSYSLLEDGRLIVGLNAGLLACFDEDCRSYLREDGREGPIRVEIVSKGFDLAGALAGRVKVRSVLLAFRQYLRESSHAAVRLQADYANVQYSLDNLDESLVYGEGIFGEDVWGWQDLTVKELPLHRKASRLTLYIKDDATGEPLVFYGAAVYYKPRRVRADRGSRRTDVDYGD